MRQNTTLTNVKMALKIAIFGPFGVMYFLFVLFEKTCSSEQLLDELVSDLNHLINRCRIEATRRFVLDVSTNDCLSQQN